MDFQLHSVVIREDGIIFSFATESHYEALAGMKPQISTASPSQLLGLNVCVTTHNLEYYFN